LEQNAGDFRGQYLLEVIHPHPYDGYIFGMHHDGVIPCGDPFVQYEPNVVYRFPMTQSFLYKLVQLCYDRPLGEIVQSRKMGADIELITLYYEKSDLEKQI
jgi:hypothetical protein